MPLTTTPSPAGSTSATAIRADLQHIIYALSDTLDLVGTEQGAHGKRIAIMAAECARHAGLDPYEVTFLFDLGLLHDIGVSSTWEHQRLMTQTGWDSPSAQAHCERGAELLRGFRPMAGLAEPIRFHHTRWEWLITEKLPTGTKEQANLIFLVERVNNLATPYAGNRAALLHNMQRIRHEIAAGAPLHFAPQLVEWFMAASTNESFWLNLEPPSIHAYLGNRLKQSLPLMTPMRELRHLATIFSRIVDAKSPYLAGHSPGVANVARFLAERLGLSAATADKLEIAGLVHDVGKLRIPDEIFDKQGRLDEFERHLVNTHAYDTFQILRRVPGFDEIRWWVAYDLEEAGSVGNPFAERPEIPPVEARILRVADIFQAMAQDRPYRKALPAERIKLFLQEFVGKGQLDADTVEALLADLPGAIAVAQSAPAAPAQ